MKKIITAALSVLLGALGYTVVDNALVDRVATLESEVFELREEISQFHYTTRKDESTTFKEYSTIKSEPISHKGFYEGAVFKRHENSMTKFLLRYSKDGKVFFIHPEDYETATSVKQTDTDSAAKEIFLYLTDCSAQVTSVDEKEEFSYSYDNDYSVVSESVNKTTATVAVTYKGYTDPDLNGREITFYPSFLLQSSYIVFHVLDKAGDSEIKSDGTFEYTAIYTLSSPKWSIPINEYTGDLYYSIYSMSIS